MATGRVTVQEVRTAVLAALRLLEGPRLNPHRALAVLAPYSDRDDLDGAKPGQAPRLRAVVRALVADAHRELGRATEAADWYLRAGSDGPAGGPPFFAPVYAEMVIDHRIAGHYRPALEFLRAKDAAWRARPLAARAFWTVYWHVFVGWWQPEYRRLRSREPRLQSELERLLQAAGGAAEPVAVPDAGRDDS